MILQRRRFGLGLGLSLGFLIAIAVAFAATPPTKTGDLQATGNITATGTIKANTSVGLGASGPTWASGASAPSGACATGSLYSVTTSVTPGVYVCASGSWLAIAGGTITGSVTNGDLVAATGSTAIGNYAGSSPTACTTPGNVVTGTALSAAGALTHTCSTLATVGAAAGTGTVGTIPVWNSTSGALVDGNLLQSGTTTYTIGKLEMRDGLNDADFRLIAVSGANYIEAGSNSGTSAGPLYFTSLNDSVQYGHFDASGNFFEPNNQTFGTNSANTVTMLGTLTINASGATVTSGSGGPGATCTTGSLYLNTAGGTSTTLYVCTGTNTWTAK